SDAVFFGAVFFCWPVACCALTFGASADRQSRKARRRAGRAIISSSIHGHARRRVRPGLGLSLKGSSDERVAGRVDLRHALTAEWKCKRLSSRRVPKLSADRLDYRRI